MPTSPATKEDNSSARVAPFPSLAITLLLVVNNGDGSYVWKFSQPVTLTSATLTGLETSPDGSSWQESEPGSAVQTHPDTLFIFAGDEDPFQIFYRIINLPTGFTPAALVTRPETGSIT